MASNTATEETLSLFGAMSPGLHTYKENNVTVVYCMERNFIHAVRLTKLENLLDDYSELRWIIKPESFDLRHLNITCPVIPEAFQFLLTEIDKVIAAMTPSPKEGWQASVDVSFCAEILPVVNMLKFNMMTGVGRQGMTFLLGNIIKHFGIKDINFMFSGSGRYDPLSMPIFTYTLSKPEKKSRRSSDCSDYLSQVSSACSFSSTDSNASGNDLGDRTKPPTYETFDSDSYRLDKPSHFRSSTDVVVIKECHDPTCHIHVPLVTVLRCCTPRNETIVHYMDYIFQLEKEVYSYMHNQEVIFGLVMNACSAVLYHFKKVDGLPKKSIEKTAVASYIFRNKYTSPQNDGKPFTEMVKDLAAVLKYMEGNNSFCTICKQN